MRPIKFRAWDVKNKRFIENVQDLFSDMAKYPACFADVLNDDNYIVEQYTGINDKNGVEIYEGDIIHWKDEVRAKSDWTGQVVRRGAGFHVDNGGSFSSTEWLETASSIVEVVGNVHENPELQEADK